jgi:HK97 family phage major capsid protein
MLTEKELKKQLEDAKANLVAYKSQRFSATGGSKPASPTIEADEKKAAAKWGVKSLTGSRDGKIQGLLNVNTADRRFKFIPLEEREAVKALKEAADVTLMIAQRFEMEPTQTKAYDELVRPSLKALGINAGESGAEWVPTMVSDSYVEEYNLDRKVAALFTEIKMPSNPFTYPVLSNGAIARRLGEATKLGSVDSFNSSQTITFTAVKMSNQYELPEELIEDSAVDVMKVIRMELIQGQEKAMEIAILEGDTASTHQHATTQISGATGAPSADSSERFFDGLRKRALAASLGVDAGGGQANESHLSSARQKLGKYGVNPAELAWITSPVSYNEMLALDDVRTLEQYGPQAPVLTGELAKYEGIPVIVSEYLREDTNATGVNSATASNFKSIILVNRKRWFVGMRRAIQVRVENYRTQFDLWDMVSFQRKAFQGVLKADGSNAAGEKSVALIYHIG